MRNIFFASLAALSLAVSSPVLHADTFNLTLTTDSIVDVLSGPTNVLFNGVNAQEYTYTNLAVCAVGIGGCSSLAGTTLNAFTVVYADLSPTAAVVNVTDVCSQTVVLGSAPNCQSFAFSITDVTFGNGAVGIGGLTSVLALADVNVGVGLANLTVDGIQDGRQLAGADLQGVSDQFQFTAATPEPGSLALLATGALSGAGFVRRKVSSRS